MASQHQEIRDMVEDLRCKLAFLQTVLPVSFDKDNDTNHGLLIVFKEAIQDCVEISESLR